MKKINIHNLINLRGMKQQSFQFALSKFKGGMKNCYTKGCEIFTPLSFALKNVNINNELEYQKFFNGENN